MKKFKYRAETYISYLEHLRDMAMLEMKDSEKVIRDLKESIVMSDKKIESSLVRNSQFQTTNDSIHWIQDNNQFVNALRIQSQHLRDDLIEAEKVYKENFERLVELQKKLKSVEKHKEKKVEQFRSEAKKKEQKVVDEMNVIRHGGKNARSIS